MERFARYLKGWLQFYWALFRLSFKKRKSNREWPKKKWVLGHRGARANAPENTLTSFMMAMDYGADGVELDVCMSSDAIPVVIHDESLERTTDGRGLVKEFTAEELSKLDATKIKPGFFKEGVPTLESVLRAMPEGAIVNVELKDEGNFSKRDYVGRVVSVLHKHAQKLTIIVSSFDPELLREFIDCGSGYLVSLLLSSRDSHWPEAIHYMDELLLDAIHLPPTMANGLARCLIRRSCLHLAIWTINDPQSAKIWFAHGVDGIFTDRVPSVIMGLRDLSRT